MKDTKESEYAEYLENYCVSNDCTKETAETHLMVKEYQKLLDEKYAKKAEKVSDVRIEYDWQSKICPSC